MYCGKHREGAFSLGLYGEVFGARDEQFVGSANDEGDDGQVFTHGGAERSDAKRVQATVAASGAFGEKQQACALYHDVVDALREHFVFVFMLSAVDGDMTGYG